MDGLTGWWADRQISQRMNNTKHTLLLAVFKSSISTGHSKTGAICLTVRTLVHLFVTNANPHYSHLVCSNGTSICYEKHRRKNEWRGNWGNDYGSGHRWRRSDQLWRVCQAYDRLYVKAPGCRHITTVMRCCSKFHDKIIMQWRCLWLIHCRSKKNLLQQESIVGWDEASLHLAQAGGQKKASQSWPAPDPLRGLLFEATPCVKSLE